MNEQAKTVLIAEDEDDLREALATALTDEGFNVIEVDNGLSAMQKAFDKKPDLILLDVMMPGMTGQEVLKSLREDEWGKNAKVLVLTALEDLESISEIVEYGGYQYLVKTDWKLEDVVARVKEQVA